MTPCDSTATTGPGEHQRRRCAYHSRVAAPLCPWDPESARLGTQSRSETRAARSSWKTCTGMSRCLRWPTATLVSVSHGEGRKLYFELPPHEPHAIAELHFAVAARFCWRDGGCGTCGRVVFRIARLPALYRPAGRSYPFGGNPL